MDPKVCPPRPVPYTRPKLSLNPNRLTQHRSIKFSHKLHGYGDGLLLAFVALVLASNSPILPVVVQDVPVNGQATMPSYMRNAIRVLPALPLRPVQLKRRGKPVTTLGVDNTHSL